MMLSVPAGLMGPSAGVGAGATATATGETLESGGASGGSSEVGGPSPTTAPAGGGVIEESDRSGGGGNRWPRQETLALLKIRSDMGSLFRDANLKAPLWEDVSRKMAELGFQRSAKKCKEKFENVYKYHKRTKDGRAAKPDSKTYRFFDQLEAFETTTAVAAAPLQIPATVIVSTSTSPTPLSMVPPMNNFPYQFKQSQTPPPPAAAAPSSSTSSDEDVRRGRKRKWKDYFGRLMSEVVERQEHLQSKLLDALERAERARSAREEAWRAQETARIRRERDLLLRERSTAEAKDAAVIAFLKKMTNEPNKPSLPPPPPPPVSINGDGFGQAGSSRWPKAEVEALIRLRTNMENKYQENGPKGPLWEEISAAMGRMGYGRNPKRCKEKWENINKYYKKVKESNRKRPEDSKTCPYFQLLEEIYKDKAAHSTPVFGFGPKPDDPPIMARPEQQWPSAENDEGDDYEDEEDDEGGGYEMIPNKLPSPAPAAMAEAAE